MREIRYDRVLLTTHHIIKNCGNVLEYFRQRSGEVFVFSFASSFQEPVCTLETFRNGEKADERSYCWYRGGSVTLKYVFFYLYFLHAMVLHVPNRTVVITFHPLFCFWNSLTRLFKGCRTVYWIYDFFPSQKGLYSLYNRMADYYDRHLSHVIYLGPTLASIYKERSQGRQGTAYRASVTYGTKHQELVRTPVEGLLGFVGNLKLYQGIDLVYGAMQQDSSLRLEVMGTGANCGDFERWAEEYGVSDRVRFLGYVEETDVAAVTARWQLGLAPYEPVEENCTHYAHPGKVMFYLQYGLPVIMTRITHFFGEIEEGGVGRAIDYRADRLLLAIREIQGRPAEFERNVERFVRDHEYMRHYDMAFAFLQDFNMNGSK